MNVRFNDSARAELAEAAEYYDSQRTGLGQEFVDAVQAATTVIAAAPRRWPCVWRRVRRYQMHRFQYGVIYRVTRRDVEVLAIMHLKRDPGYWKDRI